MPLNLRGKLPRSIPTRLQLLTQSEKESTLSFPLALRLARALFTRCVSYFRPLLAIKVELQVPMLRFLEEDEDAKAIYIYPTKARASKYFCRHYPDASDYRLWPRINGGHSSNYFGLVKVFVT